MEPQATFCPNPECPARGRSGQGNIGVHSRREQRYICHVCQRTFAASTGTPYYRLRSATDTVTLVVTLLAYGCPVQAIVVAFGLDERTVQDWHRRAGQHCERVHTQLVQQPQDLGHVQADELRVKVQGGIVWLAMALQVASRLWLGATLSPQRDHALIAALIGEGTRPCLMPPPVVLCGRLGGLCVSHPGVFREPVPTGQAGRPRSAPVGWHCHRASRQTARRAPRRRHRTAHRPRRSGSSAPVDRAHPIAGCDQHGLHRALERHLSFPAGSVGPPRDAPWLANRPPSSTRSI